MNECLLIQMLHEIIYSCLCRRSYLVVTGFIAHLLCVCVSSRSISFRMTQLHPQHIDSLYFMMHPRSHCHMKSRRRLRALRTFILEWQHYKCASRMCVQCGSNGNCTLEGFAGIAHQTETDTITSTFSHSTGSELCSTFAKETIKTISFH